MRKKTFVMKAIRGCVWVFILDMERFKIESITLVHPSKVKPFGFITVRKVVS